MTTGAVSSEDPAERHRRFLTAALACALAGSGLVAGVLGTFLPWVQSGGIARNSYQIVGLAGRLGFFGTGLGSWTVQAWGLLGPVCVLPVIAAILRLWRTSGALAIAAGLMLGLPSVGALVVAHGEQAAGVSLATTGPVVMAIGSIAAIAGGFVLLIGQRVGRRASISAWGRVDHDVTVPHGREPDGTRRLDGTARLPGT